MEFDSETRALAIVQPGALAVIESAQIDRQVATAKAYPRSESQAIQKAISIATMSQRVAESMGYTLKRHGKDGKDKFITGPSVRCAEIAASTWGNMRVGSRIIEETDNTVVAEGIAWDMEQNVCMSATVSRVIVSTNKQTGETRRYSEDMVNTTKQAACALASRNAVFKVIPKALIMEVYEPAMKLAAGDGKTIAQRREAMKQKFSEHEVNEAQLTAFCDKAVFDDLDLNDIKTLIGVYNSISDGEPVDQFFPNEASLPKTDDPAERAAMLAEVGRAATARGMTSADLTKLAADTMKSKLGDLNVEGLRGLLGIIGPDPRPGENLIPAGWNQGPSPSAPPATAATEPPAKPKGAKAVAWDKLVAIIGAFGLSEADAKAHMQLKGYPAGKDIAMPYLTALVAKMERRAEAWAKIKTIVAARYADAEKQASELAAIFDTMVVDWFEAELEALDTIVAQLTGAANG